MKRERKDGPRPAVIGTCTLRQVGLDKDAVLSETLSLVDKMVVRANEQGWKLDLAVLPECSFLGVERVQEVSWAMDTSGSTFSMSPMRRCRKLMLVPWFSLVWCSRICWNPTAYDTPSMLPANSVPNGGVPLTVAKRLASTRGLA